MGYRTFSKSLTVPDYKQFDPAWKSLITSCGGTMGAQGCAITSCAMVFNVAPDVHLEEMNGNDCPYDWSYAANLKGMSVTQLYGDFESLKHDVFDYVYYQGIPVIIEVKGSNTHFVVVDGFLGTLPVFDDGEGNELPGTGSITASMFKVNDPGSSTRTNLDMVLKSYTSGVKKYVVFS